MKKNKTRISQDSVPSVTPESDSPQNQNMSIPIKKRQYIYIFLFFFVLLIGVGSLYYYLNFYKKNDYEVFDPKASIIEKLNYNTSYLEEENLLNIRGLSTIEYLRTRLLYHQYETKGDPTKNLVEELNREFNGEKARVLIDILNNYLKYEKGKLEINDDSTLSEFKKSLKHKELRVSIFGEELESVLFPEKKEDLVNKFFLYSKQYLKSHYEDDPISKRDHLLKAKKEIYGELYEDLILSEPIPKKLELELGIQEREMSILTEKERKMKIEGIREKLRKGDL
ncbi:MAG: hypothetical protein EBS19_03290 [Spirochaetia bacterium]|nr:hypothetical protein [Spirochaetia bacterium]